MTNFFFYLNTNNIGKIQKTQKDPKSTAQKRQIPQSRRSAAVARPNADSKQTSWRRRRNKTVNQPFL